MTTTATDELDELEQARRDERTTLEREQGLDAGGRLLDPGPAAPAYVKVCDRFTAEGEVCGATISSADYLDEPDPEKSARAAWARHVRFEHPKDETTREARKNKTKRDAKPSTEQPSAPTPPPSSTPSSSRAETYSNAIAQYVFMAYLIPGTPVDDFDLSVVTKGSPMLGAGLAGIAERQKVIRQLLDVMLGEGGGPYGQTLMAALAIAAPIMAHHGHLSPEVGARWGQIIGILEVPPPPTRPAPSVGAPTTPEEGPVAPEEVAHLDDDAFGEPPAYTFPTDLPDTPTGEFTPLGSDEPTFAPDGARVDDAAHAFA